MNEPETSPIENNETVRVAPGKPTRKGGFWRFLRRLTGSLAVLMFVAIGSALLFRLDLVNRLGAPLLTDSLSTPTELALSALEWRRARIDHLRLGSDGTLSVDGIELAYDPLGTRLERVEIDRVTLAAAYDSGFSLGELDPLFERLREFAAVGQSDDPDAPPTPLPTVIVKSIEVALTSPAGIIRGDGQATLDNQAVIASFDLAEPGNQARVTGNIAMSLAADGAPPSGSLEMHLNSGSALWKFADVTPPNAGQLALKAQIRAAEAWRTEGRLEANWSLTATAFDFPGLAAALDGTLAATSHVDRNRIEISDLTATFTGGIGPDWSTSLTGALEVDSLTAAPTARGTLSLESGGKALSLAEWGLPGATLAQPSLTLATRIEGGMHEDGAFELGLTLQEPARLTAAKIALPGDVTLPKATTITLATADQPFLRLARDAGRRLVADLALSLGKTSLTVDSRALEPKGPAERLILAMPAATLTAQYDSAPEPEDSAEFTAALDLKGAQIAVPARGIALGAVAINAVQDATGTKLKMTSGSVAGLGAFVPVRAEIEATLSGSTTRFKARFRGIEQPLDLTLAGRADLDSLKGEVEVKLAPLDFAVGGLQPYNFFPPLRSYFEDVSGRIEATGPVQFAKGKLSSALKLGIENFSGKVGPVHLINVNSVIEIDRPWPLSTKPDQTVAIELADVGLPLKDALFRFKVSNGATMEVAESRLELAGGQVRLDPVTLNFDAPVHNLRLGVNQISVSRLFDLVGIAGLSGEGSISGAVPVTIFPGGIAIPDAELRADAPGVLRYDRDQAPLALQSAGESVALALQALADFHYEELIVNLRRSLAGDVHLGLHISGRNPSFYDGYPVEFNLTVEGRLDQALREGLAGYQVPDMIQEQLEGLTP